MGHITQTAFPSVNEQLLNNMPLWAQDHVDASPGLLPTEGTVLAHIEQWYELYKSYVGKTI